MKTGIKGLFIFLTAIVLGCDNDIAITPGSTFPNQVSGIVITDESNQEIGVWGVPTTGLTPPPIVNDSGNCTGEDCDAHSFVYIIYPPYPNPSDGNFVNQFSLPEASRVTMWMETAYWQENNLQIPMNNYQAFQSFSLIDDELLVAGTHSVRANLSSICYGGELWPGFYRVFLQTESWLAWRDVYIVGPNGTNPPGLVSERSESLNCEL